MNGFPMQNLSKARSPHKTFWASAAALLALLLVTPLGCSSEGEPRPLVGSGGPNQGGGVWTGPCEEGSVHACSETLDEENGVLSCWHGTQYCVGGVWGPCIDGELTRRPDWRKDKNASFFRTLARSTAESCRLENACNPSCMKWEEDPEPDLTAMVGSGTGMTTVPSWGVEENGSAPCTHGLCTVGAPLLASCHTCAARVCDRDPTCCTDAWDQACVDLVEDECVPNVTTSPISICDYGLYSATTLQLGGNSSLVGGPVGAAAPGNSVTIDTDTRVAEVRSGGNITLRDRVTVDGDVIAGGSVTIGNSVSIGGQTRSNQSASLEFPTIPTRALSCLADPGGTVNLNGSPAVTINPGDGRNFTIGNYAASVILSGPGNYGTLNFSADGAVVFAQPGTYTFRTLRFGGNSPRILLPPTGVVQIDVCTDLHFDNSVRVMTWGTAGACGTYSSANHYSAQDTVTVGGVDYRCRQLTTSCNNPANAPTGSNWSGVWEVWDPTTSYTGPYCQTGQPPDPYAVRWYTNDTSVKIGPGALASGVLIAPYATVTADSANGSGVIRGLVYANSFTGQAGLRLDSTGLDGDSCRAAGVDPEFNDCPVSIVLPETQNALNEPCRTGVDCQVNTRCTNVDSGNSCVHSKCDTGVALNPSCDSCVAMICAERPSCCQAAGGGWDATCVNMVKFTCDAWCGSVIAPACAHQPCATGAALNAACHPCVADVCAVDPTCCSGTWSASCVQRAALLCQPEGGDICDYAVFAGNQGWVSSTVSGGIVGGGPLTLTGATVGNVTSQGAVTLTDTTAGAVSAEGAITANAGSMTGARVQNQATLPTAAVPTLTPTPTCGAGTTTHTTSTSLAAGNHGNITVSGAGTALTLAAGTYNFASLTLGNGTILRIPATGNVVINVCGGLSVGTVQMELATGAISATDAQRVQWNWLGSGTANITSTALYGTIRAPSGDVALGAGARLYGMVHAYQVHVNATARVDATGLTGVACHQSGNGYTAPVAGPGAGACDYAVIGSTSVDVGSGTITGSIAGGATGVAVNAGWGAASVSGNIHSQGPLALNNVNVTGNALAVGALSGSGTAGGTRAGGQMTVPGATIPTRTFTCPTGGTNQTLSSGTLAAGTYGDVSITGTVNLAAGTYRMNSLVVTGTLNMPATGSIVIEVCGAVVFRGWGTGNKITGIAAGADALRLLVYSASTAWNAGGDCSGTAHAICFDGSTTARGVFRAPNGGIRVHQDASVYGVVQGARVYLANGSSANTVNATGVTGAGCITAGLGSNAASGSAPTCNVTTPTVAPRNESGTCVQNALGFTDNSGCPFRPDLALNMPCDNELQVCNHGNVTAPAGAIVTLYPRSGQQFAPNSPDPAWALDTCVVPTTIQAGRCATVTCPAVWFNQDLTMRVSAPASWGTLTECSELDNWSLYDAGQACGISAPTDEVQRYEARCTVPGTSPRWGTLSWRGTTPGTSEIVWRGKVAATEAGLAGEPYLALATANQAQGNQECPRDSMLPSCPVRLTTALDLAPNPPTGCDDEACSSFLEIHARIVPGATLPAPTLRDWEVTYTCVFDE